MGRAVSDQRTGGSLTYASMPGPASTHFRHPCQLTVRLPACLLSATVPFQPTLLPYPALPAPAGTTEKESLAKKGYKLPRHLLANGDLARVINR